jgi:tetratricopeptide (TPR) repeat protein
MLLDRSNPGDRERALALLEAALPLARDYGCAGIEREIAELFAAPAAQPEPPPLPPRLAAAARANFVGRAAELDALAAVARAAAVDGQLQVALIAGEPGIGKSTLAAVAARAARASGAWVLHGRCDEDLRLPYGPFVDALAQLVEQLPDGALDDIGDRRLGELARLVPAVADRRASLPDPPATDPETERYLLMNAVAATLTEGSVGAPVVFVIDDLHWADKPTLVLLRHLLSSASSARLLIVATYRPTDLERDTPLTDMLPNLTTDPDVHHLALAGLSAEEVAHMTGADPAAADALHRETDGNPLFTGELFRHLQETGTELQAGVLPDAVRGLVRQRVARLGDDVRDALATAAAIGQEFDLALLARVLDRDADAVVVALERAEAAALVETLAAERFAFAHTLVQRALYDELAATRRARTHRRIAEAIEALGQTDSRVTELARHSAEAAVTPADSTVAARHAARAGERALESLAPDEAVRWYRQALELHGRAADPDEHLRCGWLVKLADAQLRAGDATFRETRLAAGDLAVRLGAIELLVQAALTGVQIGIVPGTDPHHRSLLEVALREVGSEDSPDRARLLARLGQDFTFSSPDRAYADGQEAVAIARRSGDRAALAFALSLHNWSPAHPDTRAHGEEALALAEESGDPTAIFSAAQRGYSAFHLAEMDEKDRLFRRMTVVADEIGRPDMRWILAYHQADRELLAGNLATAEQLVEQAYELGRALEQPGADAMYAAGIQSVRWHQGRPAETAELTASAARNSPELAILRMPLTTGEIDDLRAAVEALPKDSSWLLMAAILGEMIGRRGDFDAATALYEQLLPFEQLFSASGPMSRGPTAHPLGVLARTLGRLDDAETYFVVAEQMSERMRAPFFCARAWLEWAVTLLERRAPGDVDRAIDLLTRARDVAADRGYAQIERRANRQLAAADQPR